MHDTAPARGNATRSLKRSVGLLRLLSTHGQVGWRLSDLAQSAKLDPATVHRLLNAMLDERLAARVAGTRRYTLGPLAFELGLAAARHYDLDRLLHERLLAAAKRLQGTLFLKLRSGTDSVCVARHEGTRFEHGLILEVGGRRPLCLTAGGIAMLLRLPRAQQQTIEAAFFVAQAGPAEPRTLGVRHMIARSRQLGFGLNLGDTVPGICAVAVAVCSATGLPVACLSLALARQELPSQESDRIAADLRKLAQELEPKLPELRL